MEKIPDSIFARQKRHHGKKYACIVPETFKMMNIFKVLLIGAASLELSFIHLKLIKRRLCSRLSDCSVVQLMQLSIEVFEIDAVKFEEIIEIFKEHNNRIHP